MLLSLCANYIKLSRCYIYNMINKSINTTNNKQREIVPFCSEDLSIISFEEIMNAWKKGPNAVPYIMELIYQTDKYPQFHNFYVRDVEDKYMLVFDGKEWKEREAEEAMDEWMTRILHHLFRRYEDAVSKGIRVLEFESVAFIRKSQFKNKK